MGAHTRADDTGAVRFRGIVGTTMQTVGQRARCPVLIVSRPCATCFWYFNKIIFGTDFSKASMSAFDFAYKMANAIGCKLYLFHALDIDTSQAGVSPGQKSIEDQITAAREKIKKDYISRMNGFDNYEVAIWEGIPYVELLKFARENSGDLIVMAHHTRDAGQDDALLGTTVEQVVLRSSCPVASVNRPDHI
jgi:nucleotide-binding universal stress UspA family protein